MQEGRQELIRRSDKKNTKHQHAFLYSNKVESTIALHKRCMLIVSVITFLQIRCPAYHHQPKAGSPLIADRAVNFMEIGDFLILWTYSQ